MPKSLYLIDGHAQIYRAYYAPFRDLTSPTGEPTRATYVFFQMLLSILRSRRPDYLAVVLDADESQLLRKQLYPQYKANRDPAPEDLEIQERRIITLLETAGVPMLRLTGHEADDIMATLVRRINDPDLHVYLVSRDKDLDQLLSPRVSLYDPLKDEVMTPERLVERKGWRPDQAIEAQTLIGDTVDNVPGVPGIGEKTAAKLLAKYGSVQGVIDHANELSPKQRENVLAFRELEPITRQLVTLRDDVPIDFDLSAAEVPRIAWQRLRPLFAELGFRGLQEDLPAGDAGPPVPPPARAAPPAPTPADPPRGRVNLRAAATALREPAHCQYERVDTPALLASLCQQLAARPEFCVDTETTGVSPIDCDLVGISLAWEVGRASYIPVRSFFGAALPLDLVRERLGPLLADPSKRKIGQNIKYDLLVLRQAGLPVAGPLFDTMIAAFVLDPLAGSYGVDALCLRYFDFKKIATHELIGKGKQQITMDQVPPELITQYAGEDADYTWRLFRLLEPALAPAGVARLFDELEMPLVTVLAEMELAGIRIDVEFLRGLGEQMAARTEAIAREVHGLAGVTFNLDSPKQLAEVLFDKLGYRVVRTTKTARSTDAETLEALGEETGHPIFSLLLEYRELQKLRGTYVDALPAARSRRTGRVHTSYHQTGAVTGRLSSSEPNLQNIPIRTELGRQIRKAFVPRSADEVLVVADYSQVELRMLAHFCQDEALLHAFAEDQDIHAVVAAQVNGVPLDAVTREMRGRAKAVNFGIIYGQTAFGLAAATGMSRTEAQRFIDAYFARYPRIRGFIDETVAAARREGGVRTLYGRWRPIEGLDSRNPTLRNQAERFAVNTVIQGSAADLMKLAMVRLHARLHHEQLPLRMLLQVHDELVCEGPRATAADLAAVLREEMSTAMQLRVPLKVDVACGENWLEAK